MQRVVYRLDCYHTLYYLIKPRDSGPCMYLSTLVLPVQKKKSKEK